MDLFAVVKLAKLTQVTVGVRPLRESEAPVLEASAGRLLELAQEEPSDVSQPLVNATPIQMAPAQAVVTPEVARAESSTSVGILKVNTDSEEERQGVKRKAVVDAGEGTSKRRRHIIVNESSNEETSVSVAAPKNAQVSPFM